MQDHGFSRRITLWSVWAFVVLSAGFDPEFCLAQPARRIISPAPLGSPYVAVGPVANPFGSPPMAIGPAPAPFGAPPPVPYYYGPPVGTPFGYPPPAPAYPPVPYMVRRPTPFDAANPAMGGVRVAPSGPPMSPEQPVLIDSARVAPVMSFPAPIGNLRLSISENFLNRVVARDEQKPGDVQDFILGAQVTGRQITDTKVRLDLLPNAEKAQGAIVLNGITQSQTKGVTPQAMVDTASQQQFRAVKEIYFDGLKFSTRHAVVFARARNQTMGAQTPFSGTLFGGIADRIAFKAAEKRQAESEAIARDKVAERVFPEFDNGIDKRLATANDQLEEKVRPILRRTNFMPSQQQLMSTDTYLSYSIQLGDESPGTSAEPVENQFAKDDGAHLLIHETLLNHLIARSGLKGLKTTDREIRAFLIPYAFNPPTGDSDESPLAVPGMENVVTNIEFDETDPLTIKLEKNRAVVTMRALFKPAGKEVLPALAITIEYKTEVVGDKIVVTPGDVDVALQDEDQRNATTGITLKLISNALESSLLKLAVDRGLPATYWPFGGPVPGVTGIRSQDGWAAVSIN